MTVNLSSRPFSLTIAGVDRTSELASITLSQPSTLERRDAPTTGSITLTFNPLRYNEFITIGDPVTAANWAVESAVVFQTANESGTLVNYFTGFILKEPSPPNIGFNEGTLQIDVGDILAYQSQRTADSDVSGVTIGTNTDRDEIVVRVLENAGITSHSIPSLGYPFNTPIQKTGGSPIKFAGDLVGADRHVLYCNASGTVIASPIDIAASPIATLTIGSDEASFDPVDGSSIPTVTELTIAGVVQEPDNGDYPILVITHQEEEYGVGGTGGFTSSRRTILTVGRNTLNITSENYLVEVEEIGYAYPVLQFGTNGFEAVMVVSPLIANNIKEVITAFDTQKRLSSTTTRKYSRQINNIVGGAAPIGTAASPFFEIERTIVDYVYHPDGYPSNIITTVYTGVIPTSGTLATLYSLSRETIQYSPNLPYWSQIKFVETFGANFDGVSGSIARSITCNGVTYSAFTTGNDRLPSNFVGATRTPKTANDGSTRPPAVTYSEAAKTKNREVTATVNAIPLGGVPSKEKRQPLLVDWLASDAHALEYGQLEIVLINGRKQCRFMVTALTDALLNLRPRCRIDIIFNGILYRCLADAIAFSQDLTKRSIGFMCDVISTSPAATPSTVYKPMMVTNSIRCLAQASPATVAIAANITFNVVFAQSEPATAAIDIGVNVTATVTAQCEPATVIISSTFTP
jgi:hypothetical protein